MHLIPSRFYPLLFMTDFPFSFFRTDNKELKIQSSEYSKIVFLSQKKYASIFGSEIEVTIKEYDKEVKKEILDKLETWR